MVIVVNIDEIPPTWR